MPHYYLHQKPTPPWQGNSSTANSAMNVSIVLDQPAGATFTNLDTISGRLVLRNHKELDVDNILVKLEGESRTRLLSPARPGDKQKPQLEYHKACHILYKVALVFPPTEVMRDRLVLITGKNAQSLAPGTHEFPFHFKLPFNNSCVHEMTKSSTMTASGSGKESAKAATRHVKKTLPPTLSGFPGEAEIRYYLKGTVTRHYFWKESLRAIAPINFLPIEPPRPMSTGSEIFARQTHIFSQIPNPDANKSKFKSIFSRNPEQALPNGNGDAPTISIDARLPEPAILTCNEDVPVRLIVKKMNDFVGIVHLQSLEIALVGFTRIRAHDAHRTEDTTWVIMTKSNMGIPIGTASDPVDTENEIDARMWRGQTLPNTVAPSFQACNIDRSYRLDVRVGLSYLDPMQNNVKPLSVILPLKLDLEVYSGIAPPKALLDAMAEAAEARANLRRTSTIDSAAEKLRRESTTSGQNASTESSHPAREGTAMPESRPPMYSEAPPSYQDAMANALPAINAPRPQYAPPAPGEDDFFGGDEKRRLAGGRES